MMPGREMSPRFSICARVWLALLGLLAHIPWAAAQAGGASSAFSLVSVQHRPTYGPEYTDDGVLKDSPPTRIVQKYLEDSGYSDVYDTHTNFSKRTYVGCHKADFGITHHFEEGSNQDPNECFAKCTEKWPNVSAYNILVAVHGERCGCVLSAFNEFTRVDDRKCTYYCKYYQNPICGGPPDYWGLFVEYDFQSLTSFGAYDPWRYIWYTLVALSDKRLRGGFPTPDGYLPEKYFLHAVNVNSGQPQYQYMMESPGILHGIQYDIDSTRLVALQTDTQAGRLRKDMDWQYKLCTIVINTTFKTKPQMQVSLIPIKVSDREGNSSKYLAISGASTILSIKGLNTFVFTQSAHAPHKKDMKDRMYFVRIPDGFIINQASIGLLDFKVLQLFSNEKYGDVTAVGPRQGYQEDKSTQQYVYLARVYQDNVEDRTVVDWRFNKQIPEMLVEDRMQLADMEIYPGLATSQHLFNKSAIMFAYSPPGRADRRAMTVMEVNIRSRKTKLWCNTSTETSCIGTVNYQIPYAGIYNKEPGIPLSLKSPKMVKALFSMEAGTIWIDFDRATLQGAKQLDTNNDFVPDEIDRSKETMFAGRFDCGFIFDAKSVLLLGPFGSNGTECMWVTDSKVQINLPPVINISVGDSLFLAEDTIYALPRDGEYSPASGGGVQVDPPEPLLDPVVILTGALSIDECSDVKLVARDSFNVGGFPQYNWTFWKGTETTSNPNDLTNSPFRVFHQDKLDGIKESVANSTRDNAEQLIMASNLLEAAASYRFVLYVTSRWKRTSMKEVMLTKLSFAAPMVSIQGPAIFERARPERISLQAVGAPSKCENAETKLAYRWTMLPPAGKPDIFEVNPTISSGAAALVIPPFTLEPPKQPTDPPVLFSLYNFTVGCYVDDIAGDVPEKTAYATVSVKVRASEIYVVWRAESRVMTKGDILVLDARQSQDPDYPTGEEHTFKGGFQWKCLDPSTPRVPCYPTPFGEINDGTVYPVGQIMNCRVDIGHFIQDGGVRFNAPLFDQLPYCQYTRGVMMFQTANFSKGEYKFELIISTTAGDRTAESSVTIDIVLERVPKMYLQVRERKQRYPITREIRIYGTEEGGESNMTKTYRWQIYRRLLRWDPSKAKEESNDPNNPYLADKYKFELDTSFDTTDAGKFKQDPQVPNIMIRPGVLQADNTYRFRLFVVLPSGTEGYTDITIMTAGLPPRSGRLEVDPLDATLDTPRVFQAIDWTADNIPLEYHWGYMKVLPMGTSRVHLTTDPIIVSVLDISRLSQGSEDTNYTLTIFCDIITPYKVTTTAQIAIKSRPPKNVTTAVSNMLKDAQNADPSNALAALDAAFSAAREDPAVQDQILNNINAIAGDIPVTPSQVTQQAGLLADMVANGKKDDKMMNAVEGMVISAIDGGVIAANPNDPGGQIAQLAMAALGGLLPGAGDGPGFGGGRRLMLKYRNVNNDFTAREPDVMPRQGYLTDENDDMMEALEMGRQMKNHPHADRELGALVPECLTPYCDKHGVICFRTSAEGIFNQHVCCSAANPETLCDDPPCWFQGMYCPKDRAALALVREDTSSKPSQGWRRLQQPRPEAENDDMSTETSENDNWFDQWNAYNFPLAQTDQREMSDYDRSSAYHGWHPDVYKRKLMFASPDPSKTLEQQLLAMEDDETKELATVRSMVKNMAQNASSTIRADANQELAFNSMDPGLANFFKQNAEQARVAAINLKLEEDRNHSQRITRISVMRDSICKAIIRQISSSETKSFPSVSFKLQLGKTTNLSKIHPAFVFPSAFQVPADSPDYPTPTNPVTGFSFIYVEYMQNVYSWSNSNPQSTQSSVMTLIAMKASTDDLDIHKVSKEPIRVFTDVILFTNTLCLYWDRFASNTAGGAWSSQGVANDGVSCITTNLTDVGIFMDGRMPEGSLLVDAATDWERETWKSTCIGCGDTRNMFVIAVLGMVIFTCILMVLMGYVMDETRRGDMIKRKLNSRYYYDGDGLTGPMNVDDCIAYASADSRLFLLLGTYWKISKREHALLSPAFYHETFTRPQRMLCLGAMVLGIMAFNASMQSRRGYMIAKQPGKEYIMSGFLSGLLAFPIYCGFALMFGMRPMPVKKRLIKRTYNPREIDLIAQKRRELDHTSNLMPPPGYLQLPPPPPGGIPHPPGGVALLGINTPLPLPPLPASAPGGAAFMPALPPPPPPGIGGLPGIPALPALPGGQNTALPPPPRYAPPPKGAKAPPVQMLLPPMEFMRGPPPRPQIAGYENTHGVPGNMIPNSPYVVQGNMMALDNGTMGETGGTSQRPLPIAMDYDSTGYLPSASGPPEVRTPPTTSEAGHPLAVEAAAAAAPVLEKDPQHQMMPSEPPSLPDTHRSDTPGTITPGLGMTLITPRGGTLEVPAEQQVNTVFVRGQPNQALAPPFPTGTSGPGGFSMPMLPPGVKVPSVPPTYAPPGMPGMPPPPPPPPKEDDQAFVRRIRLTYMDKVIKEHEKHELLEDHDELGRDTPGWIFKSMTLAPYLAATSFACCSIFVVLAYGTKFQELQAELWVKGTVGGLIMVVIALEMFRMCMMTLIELRKFENRKKAKAGHFLPRRVKREDDKNFQDAPKPRLWKNSVAAPSVPKGHQNAKQSPFANRPTPDLPGVQGANMPPLGPPGMSGLPVAPPPPPPKTRPLPKDFSGSFGATLGNIEPLERGFDRGPHTPTSQFSGTGQLGVTPPTGPGAGFPSPPGFPSPGTPPQTRSRPGSGSLGGLKSSLNEQVKAGTDRAKPPPPPGSGPGSRTGSRTGSPRASPAPPAAPPPGYNRPKSRPTSASKAPPPAPVPAAADAAEP